MSRKVGEKKGRGGPGESLVYLFIFVSWQLHSRDQDDICE